MKIPTSTDVLHPAFTIQSVIFPWFSLFQEKHDPKGLHLLRRYPLKPAQSTTEGRCRKSILDQGDNKTNKKTSKKLKNPKKNEKYSPKGTRIVWPKMTKNHQKFAKPGRQSGNWASTAIPKDSIKDANFGPCIASWKRLQNDR